jgi:hypothetical protein
MQKMRSYGLSKPCNITYSTSTKSFFKDLQKADFEFQVTFAYLKFHLSEFVQGTFIDAQDAENEFA